MDAPSCPLCRAAGDFLYRGLRDRYWDAPGIWSLRKCRSCGHLWLDPSPHPAETQRLYTSYYTHGTDHPDPFAGETLWARCRRGVIDGAGYRGLARTRRERLLGNLARRIPPIREECEEPTRSLDGPPRGILLDVGCGDGFYLGVMRTLGWDVRGLEPDAAAVSVARARGFEVVEGALEEVALPADAYDAITMSHVIEHVVEPLRALESARRALKPGGVLLLATPNSESRGHSRFGASWYHLDPPRHLHLFNVRNLEACVTRAGLEVARWRTTGRGHLVYDASRSIQRSGRFRLGDPSIRATTRDRMFRVMGQAAVRVRPDVGDEILMFCTKREAG